jgi:6-phosphofructokinase 1
MSPSQIKRIGILTGGGDCPGLNAVIRAVAKTAMLQHGIQVFGIEDGFQGLIEDRVRPLTFADVSGILTRGGTILGTNNKCNPRKWAVGRNADGSPVFADCTQQCIATVERHGLDAIVVIGGDGTMAASTGLVDAGINIIGVPKTIDNDLHGTEITFGFLTAVATATDALDKLHSTADSHHRVMVCEVMGRNAGWIALTAGVASGSDIILIPEIPFEFDTMCQYIDRRVAHGPGFAIIVVGEGAMPKGGSQMIRQIDPTSPDPVRLGGIGAWVAQELAKRTTADVRSTNLGHIVRGGTPIAADRILATHFGYHAIAMLMDGARNRLVVRQNNIFSDIDLMASAGKQRLVPVDHPLVSAARAIGTSFGDAAIAPRASREPSAVF